MLVAPMPVAQAIDVAKLGPSMIDLAPTEFTRDVTFGAAPELNQRENPLRHNLFAKANANAILVTGYSKNRRSHHCR